MKKYVDDDEKEHNRGHSIQKNESLNLSVISHNTIVKADSLNDDQFIEGENPLQEEIKVELKVEGKQTKMGGNEEEKAKPTNNPFDAENYHQEVGTLNLDQSSDEDAIKMISFLSGEGHQADKNSFEINHEELGI